MDPNTTINFGPILADVVNGFFALLAPVIAWGIAKLTKKFGIEAASSQLDTMINAGVEYARGNLIQILGHANFTQVDTHSAAIASAFGFVTQAAPGALKTLGISESTLQQMITGKLATMDPSIVMPPVQPQPAPQA